MNSTGPPRTATKDNKTVKHLNLARLLLNIYICPSVHCDLTAAENAKTGRCG